MADPTSQSVRKSTIKSIEHVACRIDAALMLSLATGALTKIQFDSLGAEGYDLGANFDLVNYKFIVPVAGLYVIDVQVEMSSTHAGDTYELEMYKNGGTLFKDDFIYVPTSGNPKVLHLHDELYLQPDDYIEAYIYPSGTAPNLFSGVFICRLITKEGIRQ